MSRALKIHDPFVPDPSKAFSQYDSAPHTYRCINFEKSKIHNNGTPVFFDSRVLHAVPTPIDDKEERVVFSVNIHTHPTEMYRKALDGSWLKKNTMNIGVSND